MPDDIGGHLQRFRNVPNRESGEDVNAPPLTTEEFEELLRTACENDTTTKAPSKKLEIFDIAPTLAALAMLAWVWLSRQFD